MKRAYSYRVHHFLLSLFLGIGFSVCSAWGQNYYSRDTVYVSNIPTLPDTSRNIVGGAVETKPILAFRTNLLAIPLVNVGMEIPLGKKISLGLDAYYPWLRRDDAHMDCTQLLAADVELRFWFAGGLHSAKQILTSHAIGLYGAAGIFDFERSGFGHQGEFFNVGLEYVYGLPIFRNHLRLEFELGLGFIYSEARPYNCFVEGGECFRRPGITDHIRWWGPTRAQVSLVVPIYGKVKKGGKL